jgi:hypothetical protein
MPTLKVRKFKVPRVKNYQSCRCGQSHWHHSRGEAGYCNVCELRKKAGNIKEYEIQKKFSLDVNGIHIANMYVDFWITGNDDRQWVEEYKGFGVEVWRIKMKLFKALYPDIEYRVIKG